MNFWGHLTRGAVLALLATVPQAQAQQTRVTPGAPSAVITSQGLSLPMPSPLFADTIMPKTIDSLTDLAAVGPQHHAAKPQDRGRR